MVWDYSLERLEMVARHGPGYGLPTFYNNNNNNNSNNQNQNNEKKKNDEWAKISEERQRKEWESKSGEQQKAFETAQNNIHNDYISVINDNYWPIQVDPNRILLNKEDVVKLQKEAYGYITDQIVNILKDDHRNESKQMMISLNRIETFGDSSATKMTIYDVMTKILQSKVGCGSWNNNKQLYLPEYCLRVLREIATMSKKNSSSSIRFLFDTHCSSEPPRIEDVTFDRMLTIFLTKLEYYLEKLGHSSVFHTYRTYYDMYEDGNIIPSDKIFDFTIQGYQRTFNSLQDEKIVLLLGLDTYPSTNECYINALMMALQTYEGRQLLCHHDDEKRAAKHWLNVYMNLKDEESTKRRNHYSYYTCQGYVKLYLKDHKKKQKNIMKRLYGSDILNLVKMLDPSLLKNGNMQQKLLQYEKTKHPIWLKNKDGFPVNEYPQLYTKEAVNVQDKVKLFLQYDSDSTIKNSTTNSTFQKIEIYLSKKCTHINKERYRGYLNDFISNVVAG